MLDLITISSSVVPESAKVVGFRGTEAMSRPYEIEIFLSLRQDAGEEFDLSDAIGAKARLVIDRASDKLPPFLFAGVIANIEILHAYEGQLLLRALLVPRLWQLGLSRHSRLFTKMKVPDIIKSVLEENGVTDYELRLGSYDVEEHVCQYRESDLDFISRWMEREGIFYFFEHGEDGETLVLSDQSSYDVDPVGKPVRYFPQLGTDNTSGASFRSFKCRHNTLPASVRLKDYDYSKPGLNVSGSAKVASNGTGEVSLYGERFFTPSAGDKLAKTRSEELLARQVIYNAAGTRLHLRPGYVFELEEHPFASFNTRYLTIETRHSGNQAVGLAHFRELTGIDHEDVYQVEIDAIPAKTQFRAQSVTAWPRIYGFENGIVDGAADSEYAQIDEQGRYNAKFKFDESKLKGGKATTWVRMMQPHGGDIEGFHFPLRKGTEVVFSFLGGDCDRPVISGVVPNALNPSPITSANHTKNVIQTGGRNRLELEDKAGLQRITLSTPYSNTYMRMGSPNAGHELILHTDDNTHFVYGHNFDLDVGDNGGGNWVTEVLGGFASLHIPDGNYRIGVSDGIGVNADNGISILINGGAAVPEAGGEGGFKMDVVAHGVEVTAEEEISIKSKSANVSITAMAADVEIESAANHSLKVGGSTFELKTADTKEIILGNEMTFKANAALDVTVGAKAEIFLGEAFEMNVGLNQDIFLGDKMELTVGATQALQIGASLEAFVGNKTELELSNSDSLTLGSSMEVKIGLLMEMTAAVKMALEMAISLELNFGVAFATKPLEVEIKGAMIETIQANIRAATLTLGSGAIKTDAQGLILEL